MKLIVQLSLLLLLISCDTSIKENEKFEATKWNTNEYSRYTMVNDLIDNELLIKKSKEEVIQLLGNPSENGPCKNCIGYSTYHPAQGFSLDHDVLQIDFDTLNKVIQVYKNAW